MTILHTLKKRGPPSAIASALQSALDRLADKPSLDPWPLLFGPSTRHPRSSDQD